MLRTAIILGMLLHQLAGAGKRARDLTEVSLEDLMDIEVASVSRREQKISQSASAVYVISAEEIRRSGLASIPELLRMVPGVQVARISVHEWAVTARGFNNQFANKLLVLIDGRTIYTSAYGGVLWDLQEPLLEDIQRIEVIRGPGAAMRGANAVNGVINIVTRHTKDTQGALVSTSGGAESPGALGLRYGGRLGRGLYYRGSTNYAYRQSLADTASQVSPDPWKGSHAGLRLDWDVTRRDSLTVTGDLYDGRAGQILSIPSLTPPVGPRARAGQAALDGNSLMGRWKRRLSDRSDMTLQVDYSNLDNEDALSDTDADNVSFDFQHRVAFSRHDLLWGAGFRHSRDRVEGSNVLSFDREKTSDNLYSAFVDDEIPLVEGRVRLNLGTKLEHNDYTGFELQPTARLLWTPSEVHGAWGAVSRAVRTPSRAEQFVRLNQYAFSDSTGINVVQVTGNPDLKPESLIAFELGYRMQASRRFSLDVASFYNRYSRLLVTAFDTPIPASDPLPHRILPLRVQNGSGGRTWGAEVAAKGNVFARWKVGASYSWWGVRSADERLRSSADLGSSTPRQQAQVFSFLDLPWKLSLDTLLFYVDALPGQGVPAYVRPDVRVGWRPAPTTEISVGMHNLAHCNTPEFVPYLPYRSGAMRRNLYGKVTWRF
ncbi:MAG: TonB-dependent receptor [Acidobacteria bacterium]|nr:TonB-dependent receptor [Acidobacteriota bacterium]